MSDAQLSNERTVWLNGAFVPESQANVHVLDRGFIFGDAVFDTARTFAGKPTACASTFSGSTARCATCGSTPA